MGLGTRLTLYKCTHVCNQYIMQLHWQKIQVEITPPTACLSLDSSFHLNKGEGTYPGSICEVVKSITLRFFTTDRFGTAHYTNPTPSIAVSGKFVWYKLNGLLINHLVCQYAGEFRVAGIYPIFADVTTDLFTAAAVELINEGIWEPDFKST